MYACVCLYKAIINSLGTETINSVLLDTFHLFNFFLSNKNTTLFRWQCAQFWTVRPKGKFVVETGKAFVFLTKRQIYLMLFLFLFLTYPPHLGGALKTDMIFGAAISN